MRSSTLYEALINVKHVHGAGVTFVGSQGQEDFLSYRDLYAAAAEKLGLLQSKGLRKGNELIFQIEDQRTYVIFFWACILGGIIPVPLSVGKNDDHRRKVFNVWGVLDHPFILSGEENIDQLANYAQLHHHEEAFAGMTQRWISPVSIVEIYPDARLHEPSSEELAFIQFSSGSTGNPKGVMLTHRNLITNMESISEAACYSAKDSMLSWMPLTHDMGMIGFHLNPLLMGIQHYLIHTEVFVRRPSLWLQKAAAHQVTILCSPNFGLEYVTKHCGGELAGAPDLSAVRILYNGAEPISEEICRVFSDTFSRYGLKREAMRPVYGLAEASLAVSVSGLNDKVISVQLDRHRLNTGDAIAAPADAASAISFVNVGKPVRHCKVRIVTVEEDMAQEGIIGRIQIAGENVTAGYYNNSEATHAAATPDGWLNTGDLGFMKDGALYVTGREKDVLFVNGRNYYSHDIELVSTQLEEIALNKIVVTGVAQGQERQEQIVAFVFYRGLLSLFPGIEKQLRTLIGSHFGFEPGLVLPVKQIPRTTSGKLQRFMLAEQLRNGDFNHIEEELLMLKQQEEEAGVSGVEQQLKVIWKSLTGHSVVRTADFFADLGGSSLRVAEMCLMIRKAFSVDIPVDTIYTHSTIRDLAAVITGLIPAEKPVEPSIPPAPGYQVHPLTASQKRIGHFWQMNRGSIAYNLAVAFDITGKVDAARLALCIRRIIERHDSLRMAFDISGDNFAFQVHPHVDFNLPVVQVGANDKIDELLRQAIHPFDPSGPLINCCLFRETDTKAVLLADFHHIVADGISVFNFADELLKSYYGEQLPVLPVSYRDYAAWERNNNVAPEAAIQRAYWHEQLAGEMPVLEMPCDFTRPVIFDTAGKKLFGRLEKRQAIALRNLAAESGCTLHVLMFTLYALLLSKYTGQHDVIIGIPVSGREHADLLRLIGMFVNNLPVRVEVDGADNFPELLNKVKLRMEQHLKHRSMAFSDMVEARPGSSPGRNPLFDTMFVYQNMGLPVQGNSEWRIARRRFDPGVAKFDITMEIFEEADSLEFSVEYATRLFKEEKIQAFCNDFIRLADIILSNHLIKISGICLLSEADYYKSVVDFNDTAAVYPREKRIEELFMEQAARTPDAVAVSDGAQDISYRQLDQWSSSLAGQLLKKGICAGDIVAILQRRSADWLINMLAVLKAGACYLPVDPGQPSGRIAYIISSSGCKLVLTGREGYSSVEETPWMHWEKEGTGEEIFPGVENTDSTAPAYVIYTSGTTGMPKGVMVSHRALVNYITWAVALYCQGRPADFPLFTSVSFDLAITSIFVPVVTGNRVIIYDDANHASLLERVIKDNRSDIVKLTPSHLRLLREQRLLDSDVPCKIHTFIVGGEQLDTVLARDIHHLSAGRIRIFNEYGPTEATVGCMIHQFDTAEDYTNVLIGKPINNTQIYLLDKYLHPVPAGIPGEIYIGGDGLAEGYLNASELTDSRFLDNPLIPGRKMYKTGDSGVRVERGLIECRGRLDRQVKIEGHRVELAEIDYHLMCYQHMQQVVVETVKDKGGRNSLAAYYTLDPGVEEIPDVEDLIRYMAERVPYYMIPGHFIRMNSFPLTANGKVDLKALPRPDADSRGRGKEPSGDRERKLAVVWEEVLGAENVGPDSNFFQLGGDSIKAFRITARLKQHSMLLEASDILIYQTVGRLAPRIRYVAAEPEVQPVIAGKRALLPMEAWFFEQAFKHPGFYNQSVLLQLQEHTDLTLAEKAMQLLVSRHDGLRLNYDPVSKQLFYNPKHLQGIITFTDCSGYTPEMLEIFKGDFDIADDLLIKAGVIRDKTGIVQLLITAHHLLVDGVSWRTLLTDLQQLYQYLAGKTVVPEYNAVLPAAQWLKHLQAYGDVWAGKEKAYWDRAASCLFRIPGKTQGADWRYVNRKTCSGTLSREETDFLLKEANVPYKTEPVMLLLVALGQLLREWAETDELLIMMEGHGRQLGDISIAATVGWFTSMYPFRFDVGGASIGEQIKNVKEQYRMIPAHGIGFGIDRYIKPDAEKANMEKIPVLFNYLGQLDEGSDNPLFSTLHIPPGRETHAENEMYCQLEYNLIIIDGVLTIALSFNETIHEPQLIERLVEQYQEKLKMLLQYLLESKDVHFSHSDFRLANLDERDLKILFG